MNARLPFSDEMEQRLAAWCGRYRVPGATVAWMHGDRVETAAAGVVNITTGVPVTPETLFQIGSITKVYTTTLVMQFVEEGKIELDAPVTKYLPDLRLGDDPDAITIRHLLTHTSGVDGDFFEDFGRGDGCVERYVAACAELPQLFAPGTMWSYCNAGFVVLGRIIELLTGTTWDRALRERLLEPIGADHTVTLPEEALRFSAAAGHTVSPKLEVSLAKVWSMPRSVGPAGATPCSTVRDLLTFARVHLDGGVARCGTRIIAEESVREMQRPQVSLPAPLGDGAAHWGLGWMLFDWGGRRVIGHDGGTVGQNSSLRVLPEERFGVAVLTNSLGGSLLASRIMRWLFQEVMGVDVPPRPVPPESPPQIDLAPYEGVYERTGFRTTVRAKDGQLAAETVNTGPLADAAVQFPPSPMHAVSETLFLQRDPTGVYQPVVFSDFHNGKPRYMYAGRVARRAE